jgi:hypothetical protein
MDQQYPWLNNTPNKGGGKNYNSGYTYNPSYNPSYNTPQIPVYNTPQMSVHQKPKKKRRTKIDNIRSIVDCIDNTYYTKFKCQEAIMTDMSSKLGMIKQIISQ